MRSLPVAGTAADVIRLSWFGIGGGIRIVEAEHDRRAVPLF
jgi:hypothetical protein